MNRTLLRRLDRLEERMRHTGPPETLEIQFVSAHRKVTGTRVFEFSWCRSAVSSPLQVLSPTPKRLTRNWVPRTETLY
jgi:hypothetical protein